MAENETERRDESGKPERTGQVTPPEPPPSQPAQPKPDRPATNQDD